MDMMTNGSRIIVYFIVIPSTMYFISEEMDFIVFGKELQTVCFIETLDLIYLSQVNIWNYVKGCLTPNEIGKMKILKLCFQIFDHLLSNMMGLLVNSCKILLYHILQIMPFPEE